MKSRYRLYLLFSTLWMLGSCGSIPLPEIDGYTTINTQTELEGMDPAGNYLIIGNIRLTGTWEPLSWEPLNPGDPPIFFSGKLNGGGHAIIGLNIDVKPRTDLTPPPPPPPAGLFQSLEGTVENLLIIEPTIKSEGDHVGIIAGELQANASLQQEGTIEKVAVRGGNVIGGTDVGGLVGLMEGGTIINSYNMAIVTGEDNIGGLVGSQTAGTIENSYAGSEVQSTINSPVYMGLVGGDRSTPGGSTGSISNSYYDESKILPTNNSTGSAFTTVEDAIYITPTTALPDGRPIIQSDFIGWDFSDIWHWLEDGEWPTLNWQPDSAP